MFKDINRNDDGENYWSLICNEVTQFYMSINAFVFQNPCHESGNECGRRELGQPAEMLWAVHLSLEQTEEKLKRLQQNQGQIFYHWISTNFLQAVQYPYYKFEIVSFCNTLTAIILKT